MRPGTKTSARRPHAELIERPVFPWRPRGEVVGRFSMSALGGASGHKVSGGPSVALPGTPVIGKSFGKPIPAGRLTATFTAGSAAGRYYTTFELDGGNSVTMIVDAAAGG